MEKVKILCSECGEEMSIFDMQGYYLAHCMNTKNCSQPQKNSIAFANMKKQEELSAQWLFEKFSEDEWRKKDATEWLNDVWHSFLDWAASQ